MAQKPKIGLALGGGAALGPAHIGALRALEEAEIKIDYLAGTSIGGLVACLRAFGLQAQKIAAVSADLKWLDLTDFTFKEGGLLSNEKLGAFALKHCGGSRVEEAEIPLSLVCTNIGTGEKQVLTEGPIERAIQATTAIPGVFVPIEWGEDLLVDGGLVENLPISSLREMGAEYIIAVDLNAKHQFRRPGNSLEVLMNSFHITLSNASRLEGNKADLLICPELGAYSYLDLEAHKELMEAGYQAAQAALAEGDLKALRPA